VLSAVYRALERALGPDAVGGDYGSLMIHNADGVWPNGAPWVTAAQCGGEHGPWSGTKVADGDSYTVFHLANNVDPATEAIESDIPAVVLRKEYATDTAGTGTNRGGAAVMKDTLWLRGAEHWSMPLHAKAACGFGVYGGGDGTAQAKRMGKPDGPRSGARASRRPRRVCEHRGGAARLRRGRGGRSGQRSRGSSYRHGCDAEASGGVASLAGAARRGGDRGAQL
jgi:N-methylhydantoinase B/oxoprolinase/acetone carboxylase alpha subunit